MQRIPNQEGEKHKKAKERDTKEKEKQKTYTDKHRKAKEKKVVKGDLVMIKQDKTTTRPPWDPDCYEVEKVTGTKVEARRGNTVKTRNVRKFKKVDRRPSELETRSRKKEGSDEMRAGEVETDEDDWLDWSIKGLQEVEYTAVEVDDRADSSADISTDSEFEVVLDISAEELNRETDGGEELEERRNPSPKQRKKMQSRARYKKEDRFQRGGPGSILRKRVM